MISSLVLLLMTLQAPPSRPAVDDPRLYIVGPSDVLIVSVYGQPPLTGKFEVEADGTFTFPLIGRVAAGGLSLRDVEAEIRARLARGYLKDPQVAVAIEQYKSQQIFVMGEVQRPGELLLTGGITLIEALARVGSTTAQAGPEVLVVRGRGRAATPVPAAVEPGEPSGADVLRVDLAGLLSGNVVQNVTLRDGDTVFVPRAETIFVSGQVRTPGEYVMRRDMTVRQALALAGGVTDRGSTRRMQFVRRVDGEEVTTNANPQDRVKAGDTILVRERLF